MSNPYSVVRLNSRSRPRDSTPTLPKVNEIDDLVNWVREVTDALSHLLLKEPKPKMGSSCEGCRLLEGGVLQFCAFCEMGVDLLQTFARISNELAGLFNSIGSKPYTDVTEYSDALLSGIHDIHPEMVSAGERYKQFSSQLQDLVRTKPVQVKHTQDLGGIFQRLDSFWRTIATQLSDVLEHRSNPPDRDTSLNASIGWQEYQAHLVGAMDVLRQSSDALKASAYELGRYHKRTERPTSGHKKTGFNGFWSKLKRRWPFK